MSIVYNSTSKEFHLRNSHISYIMKVLPNNELGHLYFGPRVHEREDFGYLLNSQGRPLSAQTADGDEALSLQHTRQEYPSYGSSDFHYPAFALAQDNGSRISHFTYISHEIYKGKKKLKSLPATYVDRPEEADTLEITLQDAVSETELVLSYTLFGDFSVITRNAKITQLGVKPVVLDRMLSGCLDLPDDTYEMVSLSGAWSRERHVITRALVPGVQSFHSLSGTSSAEHNPFMVLKRPEANEFMGDVIGLSLVYSGNFIAQVEVDSMNMTRVLMGINPEGFSWPLEQGESFQSPEMVMVYSTEGLNGMSQTFHRLYRTRLARGYWRDKPRPILVNNWEATFMDFTESQILQMAESAKDLGAELFVLDDGWFGARDDDKSGLGDWYVTNFTKLPEGIEGLASKIEALGLSFGLWIEPEMVNPDSDLFRTHPDWILSTPGRYASLGRNQYVLDYSRREVVDAIFEMLDKILSCGKVSYIKWDMNRYITECFSNGLTASRQGTVFHSYVLGVYDLYERLTAKYPKLLFESCSSGGARFDPGILHYAPQTWTSDNTDAVERLKIQYGTSLVYPLSSMGAHVTEVPNQQVGRTTSLDTRANVAFFGTFGYELDVTELDSEEREIVKQQISFYKKFREKIHLGRFIRLMSPFEGNASAWMVVSDDEKWAMTAYYQILNEPNSGEKRVYLKGLNPDYHYREKSSGDQYWGSELINIGLIVDPGKIGFGTGDYVSVLYVFEKVK